jgi:hypothetical protein
MQTATLSGRRGIQFTRALPARLTGWRLVLDKPPLVPLGAAMANVIPDTTAEVLGVAFELPEADLEHLDLTEGVLIGNYRRVAVEVSPLAPGSAGVAAFTLTCDERDPSLLPSARYMALLVAGAEEHGLPPAYIDWLRACPVCEETALGAEVRAQLDAALRGMRPR